MINNDKEEPSKIKCYPLEYNGTIECKIDEKINLIDNEIYNIYTSNNTYNISENIIEEPIGEFTYINTNAFNQLYYDIKYFDFKDGIIRIRTSNILKEKEQINGLLGPAFDNVAECYQYNFTCHGNGGFISECIINKNDPDKVEFNGNYKIYSLKGYSFKSEKNYNNFSGKKYKCGNIKIFFLFPCIVLIGIVKIIYTKNRKNIGNLKLMKIQDVTQSFN